MPDGVKTHVLNKFFGKGELRGTTPEPDDKGSGKKEDVPPDPDDKKKTKRGNDAQKRKAEREMSGILMLKELFGSDAHDFVDKLHLLITAGCETTDGVLRSMSLTPRVMYPSTGYDFGGLLGMDVFVRASAGNADPSDPKHMPAEADAAIGSVAVLPGGPGLARPAAPGAEQTTWDRTKTRVESSTDWQPLL